MSRILNYIAKYDENLTVAQLKEAIKQDKISAKEKETEEIDRVQEDFKNVYLKRVFDCPFVGKTLQVFHILEITEPRKTTGYETIYNYKGTKLSFETNGVNFQSISRYPSYESFYEQELRAMTKISMYDYKKYKAKYNQLFSELKNLLIWK